MKKRMLVIAAAVTATMMMTCPVMADDFKVGICNYVDDEMCIRDRNQVDSAMSM